MVVGGGFRLGNRTLGPGTAIAIAANGPIDILIVNAGIAESAPFHKMTRDSWDRHLEINLRSPLSVFSLKLEMRT